MNQYEIALEEGEREDENDIEREREREKEREREREITISIYSSSVFFFPIILISDPYTNICKYFVSTLRVRNIGSHQDMKILFGPKGCDWGKK